MQNWTKEREEKIKEFIETVSTISSETESLYNINDPFTIDDTQNYSIITYNNGDISKSPSGKWILSDYLHIIDSILKDYGFEYIKRDECLFGINYTWKIFEIKFVIEFNSIHVGYISKMKMGYNTPVSGFNFDKDIFIQKLNNMINVYCDNSENSALKRHLRVNNLLSNSI